VFVVLESSQSPCCVLAECLFLLFAMLSFAEYYPGDWLSRELNEPGMREQLQDAAVRQG
jgi:hypothetical protein